MSFLTKIYKQVRPFLYNAGFKWKRGCFYKIQNDIAFCILFQRPSDIVYTHFYVIPLYMITEFQMLTYGNRIGSMYYDKLPRMNGSATDEEIVAWCNILKSILEEDIFKYFEQISTPRDLLKFTASDWEEISRYLFCGSQHLSRLRVYTFMYLREYDAMAKEMARYWIVLHEEPQIGRMLKIWEEEIKRIYEISLQGEECVDAFFSQVIQDTMAACF